MSSEHALHIGIFYLRRFLTRESGLDIPVGHVESGFALDAWVTAQRELYRRGELPPEHVAALLELPGWTWDAPRIPRGILLLRRFTQREGHCIVPPHHREAGFQLYAWLAKQRCMYRKGRLAADETALLEAVPGWTWNPMDERFDLGVEHLRRFLAREGHSDVPKRHREEGYFLGRWVSRQRALHQRGELAVDRVTALEELAEWRWEQARTSERS